MGTSTNLLDAEKEYLQLINKSKGTVEGVGSVFLSDENRYQSLRVK